MKKLIFICSIAVLITGAYLFFSNDRNKHAFSSKGSIQQGTIFGVHIGDTRPIADEYLNNIGYLTLNPSPMTIRGVSTRNHCYSKEIPNNLTPVMYRDGSWRRGSLCVVYDEGRVSEINWWYDMFAP